MNTVEARIFKKETGIYIKEGDDRVYFAIDLIVHSYGEKKEVTQVSNRRSTLENLEEGGVIKI